MEVSYRRDMEGSSLELGQIDTDRYGHEYLMLTYNQVPHLLPVSIRSVNGNDRLVYDISGMQKMSAVYGRKKMERRDILDFLRDLREAVGQIDSFLLQPEHLIFDPEYIYNDRNDGSWHFCYLPGGYPGPGQDAAPALTADTFQGGPGTETSGRSAGAIQPGTPGDLPTGETLEKEAPSPDAETGIVRLADFLSERSDGSAAALSRGFRSSILEGKGLLSLLDALLSSGGEGSMLPDHEAAIRKEGPAGKAAAVNGSDGKEAAVRKKVLPPAEGTGRDRGWPDAGGRERENVPGIRREWVDEEQEQGRAADADAFDLYKKQDMAKKRGRAGNRKILPFLCGLVCCAAAAADALAIWLLGLDATQAGGLILLTTAMLWLFYLCVIVPRKKKMSPWEDLLPAEEEYPEEFFSGDEEYSGNEEYSGKHFSGDEEYSGTHFSGIGKHPEDVSRHEETNSPRETATATRTLADRDTTNVTRVLAARESAVALFLFSEDPGESVIRIGEGVHILGSRAGTADVCIRDDTVSRVHAKLELRGERSWVTDLNSRNGTFLNEERLVPDTPCPLQKGDRLRFAGRTYLVSVQC